MRKLLTWGLWLILILAVIGVGYYAWRYLAGGSQPPVPEPVIAVCSTECAERGQCGTTVESPEAPVVLGGLDGPVVEPQQHDVFFVAGSTVEIKAEVQVDLVDSDGREFKHKFSRVEFRNPTGDIVQTGWIPEWCIERP
jgi:hypothetical protein